MTPTIVDCFHPRAAHQHGTYVTYVQGKCRCDECREANNAYERRRTREKAIERFNPHLSRLVDAEPVREHMRALMSQGMGWKRIARIAQVANGTAYVILYGKGGSDPAEHRPPRKRVRRDVAQRLLAVELDLAAGARVDATGTTRRLRALVAIGHPQRALAAMFGVTSSNATALFDGSRQSVVRATADAVKAIYDELWNTPGTSTRARNDAARKGWAPPMAWDDDTIDDPRARPRGVGDLAAARDEHDRRRALALHRKGMSGHAIAARIHRDRKTVARWLTAGEEAA